MTQAATFREADVRRAIKAAEGAGLSVSSVEVTRDGTIRVLTGSAQSAPVDEYEVWRAANGKRSP